MNTTCLFSHKCSAENHAYGHLLGRALKPCDVELLIDPFRPGDRTDTRMDSFEFDSLLLLWSPESQASAAVQRELRTALRRSAPLFVAVDPGSPIRSFRKRILWVRPAEQSPEFTAKVSDLAAAIVARVAFLRNLRVLRDDVPADDSREAAQRPALDFETTLLAEGAPALARHFLRTTDEITRYWIALALGAAGTVKAARMLNKLPPQDHPLVLEGLRHARESIARGTQPASQDERHEGRSECHANRS